MCIDATRHIGVSSAPLRSTCTHKISAPRRPPPCSRTPLPSAAVLSRVLPTAWPSAARGPRPRAEKSTLLRSSRARVAVQARRARAARHDDVERFRFGGSSARVGGECGFQSVERSDGYPREGAAAAPRFWVSARSPGTPRQMIEENESMLERCVQSGCGWPQARARARALPAQLRHSLTVRAAFASRRKGCCRRTATS